MKLQDIKPSKTNWYFYVAGVFVIALLLFNWPWFRRVVNIEPDAGVMNGINAYQSAIDKAKAWHDDALLSYMRSSFTVGDRGRSDDWILIFVSAQAPKRGYKIHVVDYKVIDAQEIAYSGQGGEFPQTILTPEVAVARAHAIAGFGDVTVNGVEAVYGPAKHVWYWGLNTPKGTVTVEAK